MTSRSSARTAWRRSAFSRIASSRSACRVRTASSVSASSSIIRWRSHAFSARSCAKDASGPTPAPNGVGGPTFPFEPSVTLVIPPTVRQGGKESYLYQRLLSPVARRGKKCAAQGRIAFSVTGRLFGTQGSEARRRELGSREVAVAASSTTLKRSTTVTATTEITVTVHLLT